MLMARCFDTSVAEGVFCNLCAKHKHKEGLCMASNATAARVSIKIQAAEFHYCRKTLHRYRRKAGTKEGLTSRLGLFVPSDAEWGRFVQTRCAHKPGFVGKFDR